MMIARKIRAYVEIPVSPMDMEHSIRYAMTITNISLSGCFMKMDQGLEVGTPISFSLPLPDGKTLHVRGAVTREQGDPHVATHRWRLQDATWISPSLVASMRAGMSETRFRAEARRPASACRLCEPGRIEQLELR